MFRLIFTLTIGLYLVSCKSEATSVSMSPTAAQKNLNSLLKARLSGMTFEESIDKYYSNPILNIQENKSDSFYLQITKHCSNQMVDLIKKNETVSYIWNEKLLTAKIWEGDSLTNFSIDWVYDTLDCAENFFISEGKKLTQEGHYYCICFDSIGLIKSTVPLLNTETMEMDWN
ncbi:MAG: hypothetical protein GQ574_13730 [Crocinitomix sp.]|nr:hypothetical protein [Crocinitomix sp.]